MDVSGQFTIEDVAALLSVRRLPGGSAQEFPVECPFCGDTRGKCSFCVEKNGELKNVYHCFHCGASGNMLTLYAEMAGLYGYDRYREAYRRIRMRLAPYKGRRQSGGIRSGKPHELPAGGSRGQEKTAAPLPYRDQVYREMLKMLRLKGKHRDDLRRRGLSLQAISGMEQEGYRSTGTEDSVVIAGRLLRLGFRLDGVPGFFRNRGGDWEAAFYGKNEGYLCPVRTEDGMIGGFQIRLDRPLQGRKYLWFTSSGLPEGTSSGSPAGISGVLTEDVIHVTEGILKAEIASRFTGLAFVGVPGVSNYKGLREVLGKLKKQGLKSVWECYDMDKMLDLTCRRDYGAACMGCAGGKGPERECPGKRQKRDAIRKGCIRLYETCGELGLSCRRMTWDADGSGLWKGNCKGIDDWLLWERKTVRQEAA